MVSDLLTAFIGKPVRVVRFGGKRESVCQGRLSAEDADGLREYLLSTVPFPPEVTGTPITVEAMEQVRWLRDQQGARKALIMATDGVEQDPTPARLRVQKGFAAGITAVIAFPRLAHPKVAEVLRFAGAEVVIAQTPEQVQRALRRIVWGATPSQQPLRYLGLLLLALGLAVLPLSVRLQRPEPMEPVEPLEPVEPTEEGIDLPPAEVWVDAQIVGHPHLRARKRLRCGAGRLVIARQGVNADLALPYSLLGPLTEAAVAVYPEAMHCFRVRNFGRVPIVVNNQQAVPAGQAAEVHSLNGLELAFTPKLRVTVKTRTTERE